jgi:hypothetical protein
MAAASWVPGRTETKTDGKGKTVSEPEYKPTLPRKDVCGKMLDERGHLFGKAHIIMYDPQSG